MNVYNLGLNAKNQESFLQFSGLGRHFSLSPSLRPLNFEMLDKFSAFIQQRLHFSIERPLIEMLVSYHL